MYYIPTTYTGEIFGDYHFVSGSIKKLKTGASRQQANYTYFKYIGEAQGRGILGALIINHLLIIRGMPE